MYIAEKDGMKTRIPESKKKDYEFMGYTCKKIGGSEAHSKVEKTQKAQKSSKTSKAEETMTE